MALALIDWLIIGGFLAVIILIGIVVSRRSENSSEDFFLGGRSMPWWLLGISMVACTFSCDTPNLVTGMVRGRGVVANWGWWAFLITGMVTVFIYAQLCRRSKVMTDLEFYEIRYSGKSAAFIRGFRSLYLGVFFNCLIMGTVTLAAIKIGQVIFDVEPIWAVVLGSIGVVIYATAGGIKSCIWADFSQYSIAMFGAVYAAIVACRQPEVGGLNKLLNHSAVIENLNWMPDFSTWLAWVPMLLIPVAVQWWAVWYPGAEPPLSRLLWTKRNYAASTSSVIPADLAGVRWSWKPMPTEKRLTRRMPSETGSYPCKSSVCSLAVSPSTPHSLPWATLCTATRPGDSS